MARLLYGAFGKYLSDMKLDGIKKRSTQSLGCLNLGAANVTIEMQGLV